MPYSPPFLRDFPGHKKSRPVQAAGDTSGQNVPKLYKSVRVVQIVIVEDVLVLAYERFVRHSRLVYGVLLVGVERFHAAVDKPLQRKGVLLLVRLRRVSVVGVQFQVILFGIERRQAPQLQDASVAGHGAAVGYSSRRAAPKGIGLPRYYNAA